MSIEPTVFVVDVDAHTREAVRAVAATMNLRCEAYASGRDFLEAYRDGRPGCLILEVGIPGVNGLEIQERLAARGARIPILFLTEQVTVSIAVRAMRAGAVHFLEKPVREHELWDAIQEAVRIDRQRRQVWRQWEKCQEKLAGLTPKEKKVLEMIAKGRSKKAMAKEMEVCVRTVEMKRSQLMKKLGFGSLAELVHFAIVACDSQTEGESAQGNRQIQTPAWA